MLRIRPEQLKVFEEESWLGFEDEMVVHSREFNPVLCTVLDEDDLRTAIRQAIERAVGYGFTFRGPVRLYIDLMHLLGIRFDTDPQYPLFGEILKAPGEQMDRSGLIHKKLTDYLEMISGPNNIHEDRALERFSAAAKEPFRLSPDEFEAGMMREMIRTYPQKAVCTGEEGLVSLIREGREEAHRYGFNTVQAEALIVRLMYGFGHGCTDDPLYPWISRTLTDKKIIDPAARAKRLEKKASTWLDHVLGRHHEGVQA
jgi:hypothetical protein